MSSALLHRRMIASANERSCMSGHGRGGGWKWAQTPLPGPRRWSRTSTSHTVPRILDAGRLQTRIGASTLTLGGLLKHLAFVEDYTFTYKLRGEPPGAPWDPKAWDGDKDWEFTSAAGDTPEQLYALWDGAVERSRARLAAALADGGLAQLVHVSGPDRPPCQPAPARLRPDRRVRSAHRARGPAPRGGGRAGR